MSSPPSDLVLTKLGHSCVRLQRGGARLVIDPGVLSDGMALAGAQAVLVTHQHPDHLDAPEVRAALERDPGLEVWAPADAVDVLGGVGDRIHTVGPGDRFTAAGFEVEVVGEWHAVIHPDIPRIANAGYVVNGIVLHPGDALTVPGRAVDTLLLPVAGPWLKLWEVVDYVRTVAPRQALPIHDRMYSPAALTIVTRQLGPEGVGIGETTYVAWTDGDSVSVAAPAPG
jgi:L-ascorbate metabolism protein UlaG (beta-lactamase superfamily)